MKFCFSRDLNLILPENPSPVPGRDTAIYGANFIRSRISFNGQNNEANLSRLLFRFKMNHKSNIWAYALI